MASNPRSRARATQPLLLTQWNCRGLKNHKKRAHFRLYLETFEFLVAVVALQEPGSDVKLTNYTTFQHNPETCILVHKQYTAQEVTLPTTPPFPYTMVSVLPIRRSDPPVHILNIYCPPKLKNVTFSETFTQAMQVAGRDPLLIVGDFNAPSRLWGYPREDTRGRKLAELLSTLGLTLHTDPASPTRVGNSVQRDTCPDLTITRNIRHADWLNTQDTLGSDHCVLNTTVYMRPLKRPLTQARIPDWTTFRTTLPIVDPLQSGYDTWSKSLTSTLKQHEQLIQLTETQTDVDNHLLHLWQARRSLTKRWKKQKHNRRLKKRILELTEQAAEYAAQLADTNWVDRCNTAARQMSGRNTWRLFRALIDPTQTRTETQRHLHKVMHNFTGTTTQLANTLRDRYLCTTKDPRTAAYSYAGKKNTQLDTPFQLHDLQAALRKMKRGTAPGRDQVTVKLLANLPDAAYATLLKYINSIWDGETPLPLEWKSALVTFIPKAGKPIDVENLRPISLTSCVGKLMETMVRDRLSEFLETQHTFADTMFGFRPQKSAQDILLQLHHDILDPVECPHNDKVVLALDLKGAFDNVKHEVILDHLSQTNCGYKTFNYVRQFLTDRRAYIRIQDEEHGPYVIGSRGTPQGAVLSPLLFNIAMLHLPPKLASLPGIHHALYADDITIWATQGNLGHMESCLQAAATVVDDYATYCGLQCAPAKSEFVHVRPSPQDTTQLHISLPSGPIREAKEIRVLGLFIHHQRKADTTIAKLRTVGDQVGRMVRRVSNKRGGLRSRDAMRLAHAFVTSRILYSTPYLHLRKHEDDQLEVIHRKVIKRALDLPITTSNQRLLALGVVNTYRELREAHLVNQYTRLAQTHSGRRLLDRIHIKHDYYIEERVRVPEPWRRALRVRPLPRNMSKENHSGRRQARAEALQRHFGQEEHVCYVDVAGPHHGGWYTAAVIHNANTVNGLTFKAYSATHAEEVAIALALTYPSSKHIITDSRGACRNYQLGWASPLAQRILEPSCRYVNPTPRNLVWAPGHQGLRGNEQADQAARALSSRAISLSLEAYSQSDNSALSFKDITNYYKEEHRRYPDPCKGLHRADERLLLKLFTNTVLCPAVLKHFNSSFDGTCQFCGEVADTFHIVWACQSNPSIPPNPNPTREDWEAALLGCQDLKAQEALVQRARAALLANGAPE